MSSACSKLLAVDVRIYFFLDVFFINADEILFLIFEYQHRRALSLHIAGWI